MKKILSLALSSIVMFAVVSSAHSVTMQQQGPAVSASCPQDANAKPYVKIYVKGNYRYIDSNGIPGSHGEFPDAKNPNALCVVKHHYRLPLKPAFASQLTWYGRQFMGVAVNGIPLDQGTGEFWHQGIGRVSFSPSPWMYVASSKLVGLDSSNGHPQPPKGLYHYHRLPTALYDKLAGSVTPPKKMILIAYAADGFPVYARYAHKNPKDINSPLVLIKSGYQLKSGQRPSSAPSGRYDGTFFQDYHYVATSSRLDQCNGQYGKTSDYPNGTYYYMMTNNFPYLPLCLKGNVDSSFAKGMPPQPSKPPRQ